MVKPDPENLRKQGAVNLAFRGDDDKKEKIEMVEKSRKSLEKFRTGSKSVSFSESEEPKRPNRLNPILPRQKKSLEEDPVRYLSFFVFLFLSLFLSFLFKMCCLSFVPSIFRT